MDTLSTAAFIVSTLLAIFVPIALCWKYSKMRELPKRIAIFGALFYIIVQIIHAPIVLLTQLPFISFVSPILGSLGTLIFTAAYLALLAALFEEGARYLVFKYVIKDNRLEVAKLFGLGWGGVESVLLVGVLAAVTTLIFASITTDSILQYKQTLISQGLNETAADAETNNMIAQKTAFENQNWYEPLVAFYERMITIVFHVCASILVMLSLINKNWRGLLIAFGAHFALDFIAVFALVAASMYGTISAELVITAVVALIVSFTAKELKVNMRELAS